jgi:hypothetical protein
MGYQPDPNLVVVCFWTAVGIAVTVLLSAFGGDVASALAMAG